MPPKTPQPPFPKMDVWFAQPSPDKGIIVYCSRYQNLAFYRIFNGPWNTQGTPLYMSSWHANPELAKEMSNHWHTKNGGEPLLWSMLAPDQWCSAEFDPPECSLTVVPEEPEPFLNPGS